MPRHKQKACHGVPTGNPAVSPVPKSYAHANACFCTHDMCRRPDPRLVCVPACVGIQQDLQRLYVERNKLDSSVE